MWSHEQKLSFLLIPHFLWSTDVLHQLQLTADVSHLSISLEKSPEVTWSGNRKSHLRNLAPVTETPLAPDVTAFMCGQSVRGERSPRSGRSREQTDLRDLVISCFSFFLNFSFWFWTVSEHSYECLSTQLLFSHFLWTRQWTLKCFVEPCYWRFTWPSFFSVTSNSHKVLTILHIWTWGWCFYVE